MLKQEHPVAKTASSRREPVLKRVLAAVVMALVAGLAVPTETEAVADLYRDVACANSGDIESGGGDCTYTVGYRNSGRRGVREGLGRNGMVHLGRYMDYRSPLLWRRRYRIALSVRDVKNGSTTGHARKETVVVGPACGMVAAPVGTTTVGVRRRG